MKKVSMRMKASMKKKASMKNNWECVVEEDYIEIKGGYYYGLQEFSGS